MQVDSATLDALRTDFEGNFDTVYKGTEVWHEKVATTIPSSTKSNTYGWAAIQTAMEEWVGPRTASNLSEHDYTLKNKKYQATIELEREDIEDDNLGIFSKVTVPGLARAAAKWPDRLLKTMLQLNSLAGPTAFDGKHLFASDHPCFDAGATTYSNLNLATELDQAGVAKAWAAMASIIGEDGNPLEIMPNVLLVPPQLKRRALIVMQSTTYALPGSIASVGSATVDNPLRGWMEVLVLPELSNQPTVWYMADMTKPVKPLIFQLRQAAELVSRVNLEDPKVFDNDKFTWGTRTRGNVGVSLPFLISKNTGTADN